ncbi:porin [Thiomicrospira cyclica]|uniref:Porin Gram-negative type n=1 Tax=Thiomicrospira cyclica (strain DSM 14477 / JCM 11371 / ALM1) TaxID=717773 RepID=F6DAV6_THICA|nr:porin [Thiomicrospira cyclica]AEG31199.1 porin Gram-negative type [Thiomicrospira cyclica ALM1]
MKKTLLAMAVATLAASPAMASEHNFFGQAKFEIGVQENSAGKNELVNSFYGTRFGVHGSEDLGNGMKGIYRVMGNVTSGEKGPTEANNFAFNEELWAGVAGDFGTVRFGRSDHAHKLAVLPFRAFTDTLADNQRFNAARWGREIGIHYRTKNMNGLTINANVASANNETDVNAGISAVYSTGDLRFNVSYDARGSDTQDDNYSAGIYYKAGALGTGLLYESIDGGDQVQITLPVTYRINNTTLRAAIVREDLDSADATNDFAVGGIYHFSRKTNVFATVWTVDDNDDTRFGIGMQRSF